MPVVDNTPPIHESIGQRLPIANLPEFSEAFVINNTTYLAIP
jgi:hypothetical protein